MHVYLDESGSFSVPAIQTSSMSVVGALAVPDCIQRAIWKRYRRTRSGLPQDGGEVKGRLLSETQVAGLVSMLIKTPVLYTVTAIDLGMHSLEAIIQHRDSQAERLTAHLGPEHHPELIADVKALAERLKNTPPQLYAESVLIYRTAWDALQYSTLLYSQIMPQELGSIRWTFDAKDSNRKTDWENLWHELIAPIAQSIGLKEPLIALREREGADYSFFDRAYKIEAGAWFNELAGGEAEHCSNIGAIFRDFTFDPGMNYGLEIADVLTNAVRRALNGNLREDGWQYISKLIPKLRNKHRVRLISFADIDQAANFPYASVIRKLDRYSRPLLA